MDYAAALLDEDRAFGDLIRAGDPATPVPTCPQWSLKQLFRHVGRGHRWAAQIVRDRLDHPLDFSQVENGKPPDDLDGAIAWLHDGAQHLTDVVERGGFETPVWTIVGTRPAYWWVRRRLHEVAVHRADAALALGRAYTLAPELAADAISEWLDLVVAQSKTDGASLPLDDGQSVHLHATDPGLGVGGEWTVRAAGGKIVWSLGHDKGTVALRGGASALLLASLRRVAVADADIEIHGDTGVWQRLLDQTPF